MLPAAGPQLPSGSSSTALFGAGAPRLPAPRARSCSHRGQLGLRGQAAAQPPLGAHFVRQAPRSPAAADPPHLSAGRQRGLEHCRGKGGCGPHSLPDLRQLLEAFGSSSSVPHLRACRNQECGCARPQPAGTFCRDGNHCQSSSSSAREFPVSHSPARIDLLEPSRCCWWGELKSPKL